MTDYSVFVDALAQQDFADGVGIHENPFKAGTSGYDTWQTCMETRIAEEEAFVLAMDTH